MPKPKSEREFPMGVTPESYFEDDETVGLPAEIGIMQEFDFERQGREMLAFKAGKKEAEEKIAEMLTKEFRDKWCYKVGLFGIFENYLDKIRKGEY